MPASPLAVLERMTTKDSRLCCGLMSGTSVDGVDAALVRVRGGGTSISIEIVHHTMTLFPEEVQQMIFSNMDASTSNVQEICLLDAVLAHIYADAVHHVCHEAGIDLADLDLIGMHGQTLHHVPEPFEVGPYAVRSTFQSGSGAMLAALTGVPVVSDFRAADMALGGQGAPLVPYADWLLLHSGDEDRLLLNIGGIANLTWLPAAGGEAEVRACDSGPGNMVVDALMRRMFGREYDDGGTVARSGRVSGDLLAWCMEQPYFRQPHPKSTGREAFGEHFVSEFVSIARELSVTAPEDLVATASECTVRSIAREARALLPPAREVALYLAGGGAKNRFFTEGLRHALPQCRQAPLASLGLDVDAKEAVCFAVLANEWLLGHSANLTSVTGASRRTLCGSLSL